MEEQIILPSRGCLPGIPGEHAPGIYLVDYDARTMRVDDTATQQAAPNPTTTTTTTSSEPAPAQP